MNAVRSGRRICTLRLIMTAQGDHTGTNQRISVPPDLWQRSAARGQRGAALKGRRHRLRASGGASEAGGASADVTQCACRRRRTVLPFGGMPSQLDLAGCLWSGVSSLLRAVRSRAINPNPSTELSVFVTGDWSMIGVHTQRPSRLFLCWKRAERHRRVGMQPPTQWAVGNFRG